MFVVQETLVHPPIDESAGVAKGRYRRGDGANAIVCSRLRFIEMISDANGSVLVQPVLSRVQQLACLPCISSDKLLMLDDNGTLSIMELNEQIKRFTALQRISLYSSNDWTRSQLLGNLHRLIVSPCSRFIAISIAGYQVPLSVGSIIFTLHAQTDRGMNASPDGTIFDPTPDVFDCIGLDDIVSYRLEEKAEAGIGQEDTVMAEASTCEAYSDAGLSKTLLLDAIKKACMDHDIPLSHPSIGLCQRQEDLPNENYVDLDLLGSGLSIGDREWRKNALEVSSAPWVEDRWSQFIKRGRHGRSESQPGLVLGLAFTTLGPSKEAVLLVLSQR